MKDKAILKNPKGSTSFEVYLNKRYSLTLFEYEKHSINYFVLTDIYYLMLLIYYRTIIGIFSFASFC
jgi:hypothetical protein